MGGGAEGAGAEIHRYAGEAIAGLIVFRVIWGFVGGEHARFADFAAGPSAIIAHVRDLFSPHPKRHLGHNALGGVAVFLMLAATTGVVATGLFSGGEDNSGPFAGLWGFDRKARWICYVDNRACVGRRSEPCAHGPTAS